MKEKVELKNEQLKKIHGGAKPNFIHVGATKGSIIKYIFGH
ncbi:MAG: hypothetical protein ABS896_00030 [Carnobacterium inhibens]